MASFNDSKKVDAIIKEYRKLLKEKIDIKYIYLYGSYANNTYSSDSDIDIAVVGDDFSGDPVEDTLMLMKIRRKVDTRIEPRPFKTSDFNLSNPFVREIINTGREVK
ncbi:MAG: nucleotidyltransferase domain-containing protein [Syntrophaceticus sp.]|jgi:predicted nucleotidyltransferase|nr:nucleotidyltransferase domain-containing protein [Syntrophaceticus sp.]MDD3315261.1 nucleotidyltransferase domain-containing protein [Syntrophaceticus sp.]MDD4359294.1 nucleotidyltransferase domain-containing protein [Syntrophaceticus sp.]MDD4783348.1 nucleotidyltransferase domain-containing protein [Syntrophaceticus sp.]